MTDQSLVTIEFQGLDEFRRSLGNPAILKTELRRAEREGLDVIRDNVKSNAGQFSNVLPNSVRREIGTDGLIGTVGSVAKTAYSIEKGRRPGEAPSYEKIERWLTHRGTGAVQIIRSRRYVRPRRGSADARALRDQAVQIVNVIRAKGTKPLPFILPAAAKSENKVTRIFDDAVTRALKRLVR